MVHLRILSSRLPVSYTHLDVYKRQAVYTAEHTFDDVAFVNHPPVHCFIDADILVEAPSRYLWAGMGDTIAKHYETHLSARNREQDYNTQLGITLALSLIHIYNL